MTLSISDIPKLLNIVQLYQQDNTSSSEYVRRSFNDDPVKHGKLPNYDEVEKFCSYLRIITVNHNSIKLNQIGEKLLFEFNKEQKINKIFKEIFIQECLIKSEFNDVINKAVSHFLKTKNGDRIFKKSEVYDIFSTPEILPVLYELDIIRKKDNKVILNSDCFLPKTKKLSQKQLDKQLETWKTIGEIAEEIVLKFEKTRLKNDGHDDKSANVQQISQDFVNAGYDIESFIEDDNNEIQEIFIEVKGSTNDKIDFYLSGNEYEKARELKEKYWLYFVPKIDIQTRSTSSGLVRIKNPSITILAGDSYKIEIEKYHITRKES